MPAKKKASERVDKRYKTKMVIPGLDKPVWITAKTKKELEEKKRQLREELITGVKNTDRPFAQIIVEWFETDKAPSIRTPSTMRNWRSAINSHVLPKIDPRKMCRAVRYKDIMDVINAVAGMNDSTQLLVKSTLVNSCRYAVREGYMLRDPSVGTPLIRAKPHKKKDAFTDAQTDRLLECAATEKYGLIIYLLYYTGMRKGEVLGLQWGDIDWRTNMIHVQRDIDAVVSTGHAVVGELKTACADRYVPMPSALADILDPLVGDPDAYIINKNGEALTSNGYEYIWRSMMIRAGFAEVKTAYYDKKKKADAEGRYIRPPQPTNDYHIYITAHWFRHNYITACVLAGIAPEVTMRIVGHASYATTIDVYTHINRQQTQKAAVTLSGVLKNSRVDRKLTPVAL